MPRPDVVTVPRLWDVLSARDRRCAVLDVPLTAPSTTLSGVQLVEWGAHDHVAPRRSRPASFVDEVIARYGQNQLQNRCDWYGNDLRGLRDWLLRGLGALDAELGTFLAIVPDDVQCSCC